MMSDLPSAPHMDVPAPRSAAAAPSQAKAVSEPPADDRQMMQKLVDLGIALSSEINHNRLMELILLESRQFCQADGGTLYLVSEDERNLCFQIIRNDTLGIAMGGTTGEAIPFPNVPLYDADGRPNHTNVSSAVYHSRALSNILDAYAATDYDFSGTKAFDARTGYRSRSFLTVPMINSRENEVIGVLQLINARDAEGYIVPFDPTLQPLIAALASQAAVALQNRLLIEQQRRLWDSLVEMIAASIDDKSPYTGAHCQRVPAITKMLATAACESRSPAFADFSLDETEWYELHVAAWLHDCGKVTTPEYVVDKGSKLETIYNRVNEIRTRFEILRRDAEIACLKAKLAGADAAAEDRKLTAAQRQIADDYAFVANANVGSESMSDEDIARLRRIAGQRWVRHFDKCLGMSPLETVRAKRAPPRPPPVEEPLLGDLEEHLVDGLNHGELYNLSIPKGTLTAEERKVINDHIVVTIKMLDSLPFPKQLRRVPEYAGGHHERMDGKGYPRGLTREQMSIPARIMAIADIFEALTAGDRPYKKAKKVGESLRIMANMTAQGHIDPDLFRLFLESGVWQDYAKEFLLTDQLDVVDIAPFLLACETGAELLRAKKVTPNGARQHQSG